MEIKQLPIKLSDITLEQWVAYGDTFGNDLRHKAKRTMDEDERLLFETDFYAKHYAHYSGTPFEEVHAAIYTVRPEDSAVVEVIKESERSQMHLFREMCDLANIPLLESVFEHGGITVSIKPPVVLSADSKITLEQFETVRDIALIFADIQEGNNSAIYDLCAQYLHADKPDHEVWPIKEMKMQWLKSLPLLAALSVKTYVANTILLYKALTDAAKRNRDIA